MERAKKVRNGKRPALDSVDRIRLWAESADGLLKNDMPLKSCQNVKDILDEKVVPFYNFICQRLGNKLFR
jgi:hypothetical protein